MRTAVCVDCGITFPAGMRGRPAERCPEHRTARHQLMREEAEQRRVGKTCRHPDGCDRKPTSHGWCGMHAYRIRKHGDPGTATTRAPRERYQYETGYVLVRVGHGRGRAGLRYEHHVVMERILGRPLQKWENVHHRNGIRHDNRPENLELWVKPQPFGQRPKDLAAWVVEHYMDLVEAELRTRRRDERRGQLRLVVS